MEFRPQTVIELFSMLLNTDYNPDLPKNLQAASTYDTNVEYQILSFCNNLFSVYIDNKHIRAYTHKEREREINR